MIEIALTQGKVALVTDPYDANGELLTDWRWHAYRGKYTWYAVRAVRRDGKVSTVWMHRQILGLTDPKLQGEHRDNDGLNNCRDNLRLATNAENARNRGKQANGTSGFKGIAWHKRVKKFVSQIRLNGKTYHLGCYTDKVEAARAYDAAAIRLHGAFAKLNFPDRRDTVDDGLTNQLTLFPAMIREEQLIETLT